jgi:allantoin racemase
MRLLVVNPNTTRSMTDKIGTAAKAVAAPGTEIIAINPESGPPSIEGYYDEVFAIPGLIAEMQKAGPVDATIIA